MTRRFESYHALLGEIMSRTKKGAKGPGFDYWSRRPGNESMCNCPGPGVKKVTHKRERRQGKQLCEQQKSEA